MMDVVGLYAAQQDVGINQNAHLTPSVIEALAADGFVRKFPLKHVTADEVGRFIKNELELQVLTDEADHIGHDLRRLAC